MSHNGTDSLLGKRKRKEAASSGDRSQARIDRYFASNASVHSPLRVDDHAVLSSNVTQTAQAHCKSSGPSRADKNAETSQQSDSVQHTSRQAAGRPVPNNSHGATSCAASHEAADSNIQKKHSTETRPTKGATLLKATTKPYPARSMNAVQQPLSSGATQPDLAQHLSVFLSALTERQQFRE